MLRAYEFLMILMGVLVVEAIDAIYRLTNKILSRRPVMFSDPEQFRFFGMLLFTALTTIIPIYSSIILFDRIQQDLVLATVMACYLIFSFLAVRKMRMEAMENLNALAAMVGKISLRLEENINNIPFEKREKARRMLRILSSANALFMLIDEIKENLSLARKYLRKDRVKALKDMVVEIELNCARALKTLLSKNISAYRFASSLEELEEISQDIDENYSVLSVINEKLVNLIAEGSIRT